MISSWNVERSDLRLVTLLLSPCSGVLAADEPRSAKPNFIVINIDDLGYADIGPFGSKSNRTPNLDTMAKEGRKLTSFYAAIELYDLQADPGETKNLAADRLEVVKKAAELLTSEQTDHPDWPLKDRLKK